MVFGTLLRKYLFLGLASVALMPHALPGQSVPTETEPVVDTQPNRAIQKKWQKKKKKKPTIAQSWKKVMTGDWASLNKYDNRNLTMSLASVGAAYTLYYYCLRSPTSAIQTQRPNGQQNQIQRRDGDHPDNALGNPADIEPAKKPKPQPDTILKTKINAVPKNAVPCRPQAGLTCGNHAFINTKWALEHIEQFPNTTTQELGALLAHDRMHDFIQQEIAQHDKIIFARREPERWKAYIAQQLTNSLAQQSLWQRWTAWFGFVEILRPEQRAIDDIATLLHQITYTNKEALNFCSADTAIPTTESIKTIITAKINDQSFNKNSAAKTACINLLNHIDIAAWQRNFGPQLVASPAMIKTAQANVPRGDDLSSDEIGYLVGVEKVNASALYKTERKRDADGKLLPDALDDQVVQWIGNKVDMPGKILIIQDSIQLLLTGSTNFYDIKAVKQICHEQANCTFGFILRLGAQAHHYGALKKITPDTREAIVTPIVTHDAARSSSHWISVVLHRVNGQNHYYITDSMDRNGATDPNRRLDVRILIEALETNNSY